MRKKIKAIKKTISRTVAFVLALMVFVSSMPYIPLVTNALTPEKPSNTTQTGFASLNAFQNAKWNDILSKVFEESITSPPTQTTSFTLKPNNGYFNWREFVESDYVEAWDGTSATEDEMLAEGKITTEIISYAGDSVVGGDIKNSNGTAKTPTEYTQADFTVEYTVYNVSNASELCYAMDKAKENKTTKNTKINITADIDLNGKEKVWNPNVYNSMTKWFYIEGNGHTIYNMRCHNTQNSSSYGSGGFVGNISGGNFIMKNLNFSNCMSFSKNYTATSVVIGFLGGQAYIENVNIYDSFIYSSTALTATLIGRTETGVGNIFIRNCSSQRCYVYGGDHSGGLTGCQHNTGGDYKVKYNETFPDSPEAWLKKGSNVYPEIVENTYSVDCTVFSVGSDSGAFISCGGKLICRNCFTNNIMYGNKMTGAFLGRIVTTNSPSNPLYDDKGNKSVEIYFENCYASGSIEGQNMIGGFVGYEEGHTSNISGNAVYKNCYTTAMVGMDYAGNQLGGFIGYEKTYSTSCKTSVIISKNEDDTPIYNTNSGSVYINCYAAGEVGNILTDTSTTPTKNSDGTYNYLGGFLGQTNDKNGTYVNCYYDMQTTAMRERACGKADQFYASDFSAIDIAVNSTSALTETQRNNLIKLRNTINSSTDTNYTSMDLTAIDNALDVITDKQKNALIALKNQIQEYNSSIDVSAINDVVGVVNYTNSQKQNQLSALNTKIRAAFPDMTVIDEIYKLSDVTSTIYSAISDDQKTRLNKLESDILALKNEGKLLPSNFNITTLSDINGTITKTESNDLSSFRTNLTNKIFNVPTKMDALNTVLKKNVLKTEAGGYTEEQLASMTPEDIKAAFEAKFGTTMTQDELNDQSGFKTMLTALDEVIGNINGKITPIQNDCLVALRQTLIDSGCWSTVSSTSIAAVTDLVYSTKRNSLITFKNSVLSYCPTATINSILANTKNTGLLTDEQKVKLIDLKAELSSKLSYYNMTQDDLSIINDLLNPISDDEKTALLNLKSQLADSGIDTSIIDEVTANNDATAPLTNSEKQALQTLKANLLPYASQIPGVTGVYTQSSKKKNVKGLAGSVDEGEAVDMGDSNAWQNDTKDDMYPALRVFYDDTENGLIHQNFGTAHYGSNATDDEKTAINNTLAEKEKIVKSYAKASVSTVLLDHWDITMNMNTGTIGTETKWALGLNQNRLTKENYNSEDRWNYDDDNEYWTIEYKNLTAGEYEFKIQQGTSWAYSFGSNKFGGNNCKLTVPIDCNVKVNFDYTGKVSELGEDTIFRIWAEYYNKEDNSLISTEILGEKVGIIAKEFTLAGNFGEQNTEAYWNPANTDYDMNYIGNSKYQFSKEFKVQENPSGTNPENDKNIYYFKVAQNHSWGVSYGQSGSDVNMSFTVVKDCLVFFEFDEETKLTTITSNDPSALTDVKTEKEKIDFEGYSAIFYEDFFSGQKWDNTNIDIQKEAVTNGKLDYKESSGTYTKTFTVDRYPINEEGTYDTSVDRFTGKSFGYKVIKDAINEGQNHYFTIGFTDDSVKKVSLTVSYNPNTKETSISTNTVNVELSTIPIVSFYGIMGTKALTGYDWNQNGHDTAASMKADESGKIWTQTYNNVHAGEHSFKVVANGTFSSGIDFGASDGGNYTFNTTETANITITFDSEKERISVKSEPDNAIIKEQYVVCGNSYLTGVNKVTDDKNNIMTYNDETGLYEKTYENLTPTIDGTKLKNYVFKVVKFGQSNTDNYIQFTIKKNPDEETEQKYKLLIQYDSNKATTTYKLYDSGNNDVTDSMLDPPVVDSYYVAGDENLTGYNWLEDISETDKNNLKMTTQDDKVYTITFKDVAVAPISNYLAFKIVADGTWDSGIDYGDDKKGGNYIITLTAPSSAVSSCNVTITFDKETKNISVKTDPDCMATIDESEFEWFLCGDERIVSEDAYKAPKTIYDTVRDITVSFDFTSDENLTWIKDFSSTSRNVENDFFEYLGGYAEDSTEENKKGKGFNLSYNVEGKDITGTFAEPVITIKSNQVTENDKTYTKYSCTEFMPGKQWVTVKDSVTGTSIVGTRNIRIIPTAYLEAGNDATVRVLQADSDKAASNTKNIVTYSDNGINGITFTNLSGTLFKNYNFALTSGYAITDINGIGYYGNYSQQKIQSYSTNKRPNVLNTGYASGNNAYFVMTSAFAQTESYTDENSETNNLVVDELIDQTLIGSSYSSEDAQERDKAKTIVKVYKVEDGKETKVFMDSTEGSTSAYHENYLKWTGQKPFSKSDIGEYKVTYYWSLADGRYLEDSKTVNINSNVSEIEKSVDKKYIEKGDSKEITYTITYTNRSKGDFTIYDVLPFNNDKRLDKTNEDSSIFSSLDDNKQFKLKNYEITYDNSKISNLQSYYTINADVKDTENLSSDSAAKNVNVTDGIWTQLTDNQFSGESTDITALAVTGTQTSDDECIITITYTLLVNAQVTDYYVNNAFFTFDDELAQSLYTDDASINGYSNSVTTAIVGAEISGYVWYDININSQFDSNETPIGNVKVELVDSQNNVIASKVTGDDGYYYFDVDTGDTEKNYKVIFSANDTGENANKIKIENEYYDFNGYKISTPRVQRYVTDKNNSVSVAKEYITSESSANKQYYIDETIPTSEEIYNNNYQKIGNFRVVNYNLPMNYQNLGLRTGVDTTKNCSLTIKKVEGGTENTLEGVKFKLEYMPATSTLSEEGGSTSSEYQPLYVKKVTDESGKIAYEFTADSTVEGAIVADGIETDENGQIKFTELPSDALYRLTEVSTLDGYNLLPTALEFALPYYIKGSATSSDGYVIGDDTTKIGEYYYDITYTVTNSKIPNMPLTGIENNIVPIIIAAVLFVIGFTILLVFKLKSNKKKSAQ